MSARAHETSPVGGEVFTRPFILLAAFFALAMLVVAYRFAVGLGPVTAMSDAYPWGAWKPFNVIVLTALGSGGYAMAVLVYVLNRGKYHAIARTALLTSALAYTSGVIALGVDIGRPWNFWRLIFVTTWNLHSVLLEVAVCISTYIIFLWLELSPAFLERWAQGKPGPFRTIAVSWTPRIERAFPWIVAMAIVLPTMHQSSLGSLFLLAGPRLHPLWQTPLVPLLFLLSCYLLGFAAVTMISLLSSATWNRPRHTRMLAAVMQVAAWIGVAFLGIRALDLVWRGQSHLLWTFDRYAAAFWIEAVLVAVPSVLLLSPSWRGQPGTLFRLSGLVALGGSLYRLNTSLIAFMPGDQFGYFPSVLELIVSLGWVALAIIGYLYIVKRFAILPAAAAAPASSRS